MSAPPVVVTNGWGGRPRLRYIGEMGIGPLRVVWPVLAVGRVVDGDTIHAELDIGFRVHYDAVVRLARCNAPEMDTEAGIAAKVWTSDWIGQRPTGLTATVHGSDRYGRWVADIRDRTEADLSDALIAAGHAIPYP